MITPPFELTQDDGQMQHIYNYSVKIFLMLVMSLPKGASLTCKMTNRKKEHKQHPSRQRKKTQILELLIRKIHFLVSNSRMLVARKVA